MSDIKLSGQPTATKSTIKSSQLATRSAILDRHRTQSDRIKADKAQRVSGSVSTRNDVESMPIEKTQPSAVTSTTGGSASLLKRSLSKLRLRDASSPNESKPAQALRQPLAPASRIPQATSTASGTRIISNHPERSAFVLHSLASPAAKQASASRRKGLQTDDQHEHYGESPLGSSFVQKTSPSADKTAAEIRMKAVQLGIFTIGEDGLKERYRFHEEIGSGQWGMVWSVEALKPLDHLPSSAYRSLQVTKLTGSGTYSVDNTPNFRHLAVKLCERKAKHSTAAMTQRLWNEFKTLRMLMDQLPRAEQVNISSPNCRVRNDRTGWHPNVVNFYEFLQTPKFTMLAMPRFDEPMKVCLGETLGVDYFQQLLSAVHWLHEHGVTHNDIKVDNLGVTYDTSGLGRDTVTLIDFGFANRYDSTHKDAFMSRDTWGTPEYLSPERFSATWHDERKSDIWALGITLFEMIIGRTPFEHEEEKFDSQEKFDMYYARAAQGIWVGKWSISAGLEDLIRGMLVLDPDVRIDAGGAMLDTVFHPRNNARYDSFDDLLRVSCQEEQTQQAKRQPSRSVEVSEWQDKFDDSECSIRDLIEHQSPHSLQGAVTLPNESFLASPGISRAAVAPDQCHVPGSPSLSQVGMDSRLTDLMCVSPPWRKDLPRRQGTPIPSVKRNRIWTSSLPGENEPEQSEDSTSHHYPVAITTASKAQPAKQSPFRLRLGQHQATRSPQPAQDQVASTPLSAVAVTLNRPLAPIIPSAQLPPFDENNKTVASGFRGNVVASLARKFDASNFLARPPRHVTALTNTGLGLSIGGKRGQDHRRSKSHTFMVSEGQDLMAGVSRRSTGSYVPGPEDMKPQCARRLFDAEPKPQQQTAELDNATEIGSTRSCTKDAGVHDPHHATSTESGCIPAPHAVLSGDDEPPITSSISTPDNGEAVIVRKLQKMASLAGLLTRMIDETKSTVMSPGQMRTPMRKRGSTSTTTTEALDISPGLLESPASSIGEVKGDGGDVSMISAAFSLDLSGSSRRDTTRINDQRNEGGNETCSSTVVHPSPAQVETMYSSFLLSQNVAKAGSGFLSSTQPSSVSTGIGHGNKQRSLAALFSPINTTPGFQHLLQDPLASPQDPLGSPNEGRREASRTCKEQQKSIGKGGRLLRLFRKQS